MAVVVSAGMPRNKKKALSSQPWSFKCYLHFLQYALSLLKK